MQPLLDGLLGTLCLAFAAAMELPGRSFTPEHEDCMHADLDRLSAAFRNLLPEEKVIYSVRVLHSLASSACSGG